MKNTATKIRKVYSLLLEHAYGSSLTNKKMWIDIFDKIGKEVNEEKTFPKSERDFGAVTDAENYVQSIGYSVGSMQGDNPRALAKGKMRIAKWWNIDQEEYPRIDGIMVSDDYRNGSVVVIMFKDKGEIGEVDNAKEDQVESSDTEDVENKPEKSVTPPPAEDNEQQMKQQPVPANQIKMPESLEDKIRGYSRILSESKR